MTTISTTSSYPPDPSPPVATWQQAVLIPLAQNLLGSAAMFVGGLLLWSLVSQVGGWAYDWGRGAWLGSLLGGLALVLSSLVRFFGDEVGLLRRAYAAGVASQTARVGALEAEILRLREVEAALSAASRRTLAPAGKASRLQERAGRAVGDAEKMIRAAFAGQPATRAAMERLGMGQRDWERGRRLLVAAGVCDAQGHMSEGLTLGGALEKVRERFGRDLERDVEGYQPSWW